MENPKQTTASIEEQPGYFEAPGAHLYTVLHRAPNPVARVLLAGPFASERHFSYHPWVRWGRYLAARGIEVLRFDYRGIGESTGNFEEATFKDWEQDVRLLAEWLSRRSPELPLLLHGLEAGAIFAAKAFKGGIGDGLLLWSPPANANQALRASLLLWAGLEQMWESSENRTSASGYIRQMEQGTTIEVQGYRWTSRLWRDSFHVELPAELAGENAPDVAYERPFKSVKLDRFAAPLVKPHLMYHEVKDLSWLYAQNFEWIERVVAQPAVRLHEE
jgi:pimeloyl-ACP methyl ester carboxylesterase